MNEYRLSSRLWAALIVAVLYSGTGSAAGNEWVIENVNLIPMTSETVLPHHSVVIRGGRIARICAGRQVLGGTGGTGTGHRSPWWLRPSRENRP